jgi:hypothetical protein
VAGCCEHGNELSGSIKGGEFLDKLSDFSRNTLLNEVIYSVIHSMATYLTYRLHK